MIKLTENVHYENLVLSANEWTDAGYCYLVCDGKAHVMRKTHPDVHQDDIEEWGKVLASRRKREASESRRIASRLPKD